MSNNNTVDKLDRIETKLDELTKRLFVDSDCVMSQVSRMRQELLVIINEGEAQIRRNENKIIEIEFIVKSHIEKMNFAKKYPHQMLSTAAIIISVLIGLQQLYSFVIK